jgi:uncharacterized membrane protein/thiol-disulfide isomerase/thioredoxin
MPLFTKQQNPEAAVNKLLKQLAVNIDPTAISAELDKHPDYPSLLAISDVLTSFGIENAAFRVEPEKLPDVPRPFIVHTTLNGGDFVVVNKMDGDNAFVSSDKWSSHKLSLQEFKKIFSGVVLTAEPTSTVSTSNLSPFLARIKTPLIVVSLVLIFITTLGLQTGYFVNSNWQVALFTIFKSAGLITSILLLIQSIDSNNPLVQVLCNTVGKKDCNAILSSKAAKVFDWLSWSEVGFFYFAGTWLLVLFGGNSPFILSALLVLNVISLPYTFYSIYYQARVAKQWCLLCCTVQALLWLEFISLAPTLFNGTEIDLAGFGIKSISLIAVCLLSPVILWAVSKPMFLKLQQLRPLKEQLRKFKYNTGLFNKMLNEQPKCTLPDEEWSIVLGNVEANNIITMVTNPYCSPCAKTHRLLDELLEQNANVQARIVFTANNEDHDIKTPVSRHLMALNNSADKALVRQALNDWYGQKQKNYEAWAKVYPAELQETEFYKIDRQHEWCKKAEVTATPTLALNGYRLPDLYQLTDLKYMLE